jgi:tetratricopeptide (TPR) repeat protein
MKWWWLIAGVLVVSWGGPSKAAPVPDQANDLTPTARELSDQGLRQYQQGDHDAAIESFLAAFALSNNAGLLFNVAQAYRLKRDCQRAGEYYRRYLEAVPDTSMKPSVERRLEEMETCLRTSSPVPAASTVRPAAADISARPTAPVQTPPAARPIWRQPAVVAAAAAALAFGATGVVFAMRSRAAEQDLSQRFAGGGSWDDAAQERFEAGRRDQILSIASFVAAGASVAIATWLGVRAQTRNAAVVISPSDRSAGLAIAGTWRF